MQNSITSAQDSIRAIPVYSKLPAWFANAVSRHDDSIFFLGISDPGLPDSVAKAQARLRACAMLALSREIAGRLLSDSYHSDASKSSDSKFAEIYHFKSFLGNDPSDIKIVRQTVLKSGEVVVLAVAASHHKDSSQTRALNFKSYLFNDESEVGGKARLLKKLETIISGTGPDFQGTKTDSLSFYQLNQYFTGVRSYRTKICRSAALYEYYYSSRKQPVADSVQPETPASSSCKAGLWIALLNQIFDQLGFFIKTTTTETQVLTDQTEEMRKELNREKNLITMRFNIANIYITDNKLTVQLKISHEK